MAQPVVNSPVPRREGHPRVVRRDIGAWVSDTGSLYVYIWGWCVHPPVEPTHRPRRSGRNPYQCSRPLAARASRILSSGSGVFSAGQAFKILNTNFSEVGRLRAGSHRNPTQAPAAFIYLRKTSNFCVVPVLTARRRSSLLPLFRGYSEDVMSHRSWV